MITIQIMEDLQNTYERLCGTPSDINEHLPVLFQYAKECESILELGVRGVVSSYAFVYGLAQNNKNVKRMFMNDLVPCNVQRIISAAQEVGVEISYQWINDLDLELDKNFDITFIDTWHVYGQLKRELQKFSVLTNKYIIMHDTEVDGVWGESLRCKWDIHKQSKTSGFPSDEIASGLLRAIYEFVEANSNWTIHQRLKNNNGLIVLKKL